MKTDPSVDAEGVMSVEDWAEIRRLRRSEGMPIKGDRPGDRGGPQYRATSVGGRRAAEVSTTAPGFAG